MFNLDDMEKLAAKVVAEYPLFSKWVFGVEIEENEFIPTLQVNTKRLQFSPQHMERTGRDDRFFKCLHEYAHLFYDHPHRLLTATDQDKRQEAMDYEVNDLLRDMGYDLPWDAIWSPRYKEMPCEEIYKLLLNDPAKNDKPFNKKRHGKCENQKQVDDDQKKQNGEEPDPPPTKQEQQERQEKHKQKQIEAIQQSRMMGNNSEKMERRFKKITESKVDWKQSLPDLIEDILGADDYTFAYPERRYDTEFILPSMIGKKHGTYVLVGDTSISISKDQLAKMATEITEIIQQNEPEVTYVLWCDTAVHNPQTIHNTDPFELKPVGGGGTSFRPPFKWVEDNDIEPTILFYLTDGYCSRFAEQPDYPVVWIVWQDVDRFQPPYGDVVVMHNN